MDDNQKEDVSEYFMNWFGIGWWASAGGKVFATMTQEKLKELESYVHDLEKRLELFKGANNSARVRLDYVEMELSSLKEDARILATSNQCHCDYCNQAARRILEATKED